MNDELYSLDELLYSLDELLDKLTKINNFEIELTKIQEDSQCPKLNSIKLYLSICKEIKRINEELKSLYNLQRSLDGS
jgi:hypothetical protein